MSGRIVEEKPIECVSDMIETTECVNGKTVRSNKSIVCKHEILNDA